MPRLGHELHVARGDSSLPRVLTRWAKIDVLILDDWGLTPLGAQERHDLLDVLEDRCGERSTLDRVVHTAHHIILNGESMRKKRSPLTRGPDSAT
ncbi:MAG TPA: ATP-binding protein [Candidatus Binatia bacterium]|nr:ATP-binding protein [Candidatus Binatia bacterium]